MIREWNKFKVNKSRYFQCVPFSSVYHVTHIDSSISIIKDSKIQAKISTKRKQLIEEKLAVTWVSPDTYDRNGSIAFEFIFDELVGNKNIFWLTPSESMPLT